MSVRGQNAVVSSITSRYDEEPEFPLTTFRVPSDQITSRWQTGDLGLLEGVLLPQQRFLAPLLRFLVRFSVANGVWQRADGPFPQNDTAAAIAGVEWKQVAPNALFHLILDFVRQCSIGVNVLRREGLCVLRG